MECFKPGDRVRIDGGNSVYVVVGTSRRGNPLIEVPTVHGTGRGPMPPCPVDSSRLQAVAG